MDTLPWLSLYTVIGLLAAIGLIYGLRAFLGFRSVARDAEDDYTYKAGQKMIPKGMTRERYIQIYRRVNNPRGSAYVAAGLGIILILTPPLFWALEWTLNFIYNLSGQDRVIEPGYLVWQFIVYFVVLMAWALIAYFTASRYHRGSSGSLQFELDQDLHGETDLSDYEAAGPLNQPGIIIIIGFFVSAALILIRIVNRSPV